MPALVRYAACAALIVGAAASGYKIGGRVLPSIGQLIGAIVLGGLGAGAAHLVNSSAIETAVVELHNYLVRHPDPAQLKREEVEAIAKKFGMASQDPRFVAELKELYASFLSGIIPPGEEPLTGNEPDTLLSFKRALGLEDDDAASVHIEVGRRLFRQRMETGDKDTAVQERKTFQKLVYVSNLVFGEASKFLLPWKRIFKVTDSQVEVAIRNCGQALFQSKLDVYNAEPVLEQLQDLRGLQRKYKVADETAAEMFRAQARKRVEFLIGGALEVLKSRARVKDMRTVLSKLDAIREYNNSLAAVSKQAPEETLVAGVGPVTVFGGEYSSDRQMEDLKLLYRTYLSEALNSDSLDASKVEALAELRNVFGMGTKEAAAISADVTRKVYRRKLSLAVQSGKLEEAPSKAAFLEDLCDRLHFDPELASQVHEEVYRQKLEQCLEDNVLSDQDMAALLRLRILLCIPQAVVDTAHAEICGRIFAKVVDDAISAGMVGYDAEMKKAVQDASKGLRLPQQAAVDIASKAVKSVFLAYTKRCKSTVNRAEAARELKKMIMFSNLTVSELLDDIRGGRKAEEADKAGVAEAEPKPDPEPEWDDQMPMLQSMRKTRGPAKEGRAQKEISIADELELRDRQDLFRTYLLYCIQGDTKGMPMGTSMVVQRDDSEFTRLGQLGDILGLLPLQQAEVHQGLAEQAFRSQAQVLLADGQLSKTRVEQLKQLQRQLGLPEAAAQKVVQSITSTKMAGAIDLAVQQGRLSIDDIRGLKEAGVDIQTMVNAKVRTQMFEKLVQKALSAGTGEFDAGLVFGKLPDDLGLDVDKMAIYAKDLAREKLKDSLVQAVSLLRQKKSQEVIGVLNNILSCDKAERATEALTWPVKEELFDLYAMYLAQPDGAIQERVARLQELLGIDETTASSLSEMVESGGFSLDTHEENFVF